MTVKPDYESSLYMYLMGKSIASFYILLIVEAQIRYLPTWLAVVEIASYVFIMEFCCFLQY